MLRVVTVLAVVGLAMPARAVSFFSIGGAPDPGLAQFETSLVSFDAPNSAGIVETDRGDVGLFTGSHWNAAAPAGDATRYMGIGGGGAATFDFRGYFSAQSQRPRSFSVYVGSVDTYNHIDILDRSLAVVSTINGVDLPGSNGDQGAAITNRRLYINFDPLEQIGGLTFRSDGIAFEFDSIAASSARFRPPPLNGAAPDRLPSMSITPEPEDWVMLLAGFGLVGVAVRRRRGVIAA